MGRDEGKEGKLMCQAGAQIRRVLRNLSMVTTSTNRIEATKA